MPIPREEPEEENVEEQEQCTRSENSVQDDEGEETTNDVEDASQVPAAFPQKNREPEYSSHCPVCHADVALLDLKPHVLLRELIGDLRVLCGRRCGWKGSCRERPSHDEVCPLLELERLERKLASMDEEIETLEEKRDAQLTALAAQACDDRILERDRRVTDLETRVADGDNRLIDYGKQLLEREVQIAALERRLQEQNAYVEQVFRATTNAERKKRFEEELAFSLEQQPDVNRRATSSLEDMIAGNELDM